jgi:cystathionine gamma-synthase
LASWNKGNGASIAETPTNCSYDSDATTLSGFPPNRETYISMENIKEVAMKFDTLSVHAAAERDATGAIAPPLHLSTIYEHGPAAEILNGFFYVRADNPIQHRLESALASVEGGQAALVFASGVAAGATYLQSLPFGSHVLFSSDLFYGFRAMASSFLTQWGLEWSEIDMSDPIAIQGALRPNTRSIWAEMPTNPSMRIVDLAAIARIAHDAGANFIVDSTFSTPALLQPLALGADVVLHSTTKYLGGHSDVQGGALVFALQDELFAATAHCRKILGSVAAPFNSWLVLRGLRTLSARMRVHSANAQAVADFLESSPHVAEVLYPGLVSSAGHSLAKEQMSGFGGMLSFRPRGGRSASLDVASRVQLFINAGSFGGSESLIQHAASAMHPADGIPDDLLRLSIGLEHPEDLIADLKQSLESIH